MQASSLLTLIKLSPPATTATYNMQLKHMCPFHAWDSQSIASTQGTIRSITRFAVKLGYTDEHRPELAVSCPHKQTFA